MATDADVAIAADTSVPTDATLVGFMLPNANGPAPPGNSRGHAAPFASRRTPADFSKTTAAETDSNHGALDRAILNGSPGLDEIENKHITSVEDQINSADVSVSGGSDTEASKGDSTTKGDKSHLRSSSSVKKPATFKAVSVNKTFLAAKGGPASSPAVKAADKSNASSLSTTPTGASALSASRPRLVAKTGAAGSAPKFSSGINGAKGAAGPDANAVWNKNRPVPPPEPKKLTDEELKKFGIHMASRLGPESTQGHNNWADIDDDDDDWAPDTITWTDGTKVTVHENAPPPLEPVPAAVKEKPRLAEGTRSPAPPGTASPSTKPATLPSGKGLILKGGSSADKPALVAKPPAPTSPAKSPWAKLPPIEKASPADPPPSLHGHLPVRDPRLQSISPPPAREIAADDFSRSTWREGPATGTNQLFNSQSGRYEPVGDRRGSFRSEAHFRQPAVLQRPSQSDHPEPSAAFQTTRTQQEGPFGRRRGSSNLSGGNFPQRPSFGPHDVPPGHRRGSLTASIESANSPQARHISPVDPQGGHRYQPNQSWQPRASPALSHASLHLPNAAGPPHPEVAPDPQQPPEDFEFQKRIMHEKRELAMQRRREQEAREEEEKQKRIQAKLAALGPAPERKSTKKEPSHEDMPVPVQIQQRRSSSDANHPAQAAAPAGNQTSLPSEHGDQPATQHASGRTERLSESSQSQLRNRQEGKPASEQADGLGASAPANPRARPDTKAQWGQPSGPQAERFTSSWSASGQQSSSSVWAPNNLRGLGNGTFNAHLGRGPVSPPTTTAQPARGPAPIAPPSAQRLSNIATQQASAPGSGRPEPLRSRWANAVTDNDKVLLEQNRARMADQERDLADRGMTLADSVPEIKDTWRPHTNNATLRSGAPDASIRSGPPAGPVRPDYPSGPPPILPQASSTPQSRSRFFPTPTRDVRQESAPAAEPQRPSSPSPPPPDTVGHPAFDGDAHHPHVSLPRPQPVVRLPPSAAAPTAPAAARGSNFSWSNPAPFRDPTGPAPTGPAGRARDWNLQPAGHGPVSGALQDGSHNKGWGEKFRNLFSDRKAPAGHKVTSPSQATFVDASSRSLFHDEGSRNNFATVSLPRTPTKAAPQQVAMESKLFSTAVNSARKAFNDSTGSYMVKPVSEECFEAQEMGSLPAVNIPREAPEAAWHPATPPAKDRTGPRRLMNTDISSSPLHWVPQDMGSSGSPEYRIKFPGMDAMRSVPAPALRTRSNPRRASGRGARASQAARGGKNADASSQSGDAPPPRPSRGGRGSYRGRGGSDWSRRTSSTQANQ